MSRDYHIHLVLRGMHAEHEFDRLDTITGGSYDSTMPDHTPHQRKIIEGYYNNRDVIMLTRLQEIVTELYLAEDQATLDRLWGRADKAMQALEVPHSSVASILAKRDPEVLARRLRDWLDTATANRRGDRSR